MKKALLYAVTSFLSFLFLISCESEAVDEPDSMEDVADDEQASEDDDLSDNDNPEDGNNEPDSNDSGEVSLTAEPEILVNNGEGIQNWGEGVTLEAFKIDGSPAKIVYDTQFKDKGFGIAGARWDQIDYYVMYQGEEVNASEKLKVGFNAGASDIVITVGMMGANEGHPDGETGKWTGYDQNGEKIAEGVLGANNSNLGAEVKSENGSYGTYPIDIESQEPIYSLIIEATGFGYGEGEPKNVNSYDNESGNKENNSDFNIVGISFKK